MSRTHDGVPRPLLEQALLLISREQYDAETDHARDAIHAELGHWRSLDERHEQAYQLAQKYWRQTDASALRSSIARPQPVDTRQTGRRRVLQALACAGVALGTLATGRWWWQQPVQSLSLSTGHGQQLRGQQLLDGSVLDLAAATTLQLALYRDRRRVELQRGEARFAVARDADRPFEVNTPLGRVRVLGTVFGVSVRDNCMTVSVAEGRVAVWRAMTAASAEPEAILGLGQQIHIPPDGELVRSEIDPGSVGAWRDGWLVFDRTPLPQVIARWNDYLRETLELAPLDVGQASTLPDWRDLRLTGSFPLRHPEAFLQNLPLMLPVRVEGHRIAMR